MASHVPPKKNDASGFVTYVSLVSQANPFIFQVNPTLAAGDIKVAVDDAAPGNISAMAVDADFTKRVKLTLSQAQTNGDVLTIICSDAAGAEWCDREITLHTSGQTLNEIDALIDAIKAVTDVESGVKAVVNALNNLSAAQVNAQVLDVLSVDPIAELAQAVPAVTPTVFTALMYLYMIARNKLLTTSSELSIHNDAGLKIVKRALSDDGTTFTEDEAESGA